MDVALLWHQGGALPSGLFFARAPCRSAHLGATVRMELRGEFRGLARVKQKRSALTRGFFLCSCKERTKESTPFLAPAFGGFAEPAGIFGRDILPLPKTAHILVRRLCGFSHRLRRCGRG